MSGEIQVRNNGELTAYSPTEVMAQVEAIQGLMSMAMKEGEHYGKIPGCGDKPTLLKAGAEKLTFMFRLSPKYDIQEKELPNGHIEYRIVTSLTHINTGLFMGQGLGLCSTMETKYRYRDSTRKCPECGGEFIIKGKEEYGGGFLCFKKKGGCGAKFSDTDERIIGQVTGKVEYDNPADHKNTVLKMAKKRSLVDATLTCTAASDIFIQDIEDLVDNGVIIPKEGPAEKPLDKKNEIKIDRNFTEEANNCKSLEELQKWFTQDLTKEERKLYDNLKENRKAELLAVKEPENKPDILMQTIDTLNKKNFDKQIILVEKLIEDHKGEKLPYCEAACAKIKELGVDYSLIALPF